MKILIFYFSGTGNTEKVAKAYADALAANGACVISESLPEAENKLADIDFDSYDLLGFGYPIHAFNAPANLLTLAEKLPKFAQSKRAFIFKTSGEPVRMSDVSSLKLIKTLRKHNVQVTNEYQYVMPYNIIFRHSDRMAYRMWNVAQKVIPIDCAQILEGTPHSVKRMFMGGLLAWFLRIEHWGARFNGKRYKVNKDCIRCGYCVRVCPTKNITIDEKGKFRFGNRCLMCMRCAFGCPKAAIEIGLFKSWKVNGAYSFDKPAADDLPQADKHANYCKKAYNRYFAAAEDKIRSAENKP